MGSGFGGGRGDPTDSKVQPLDLEEEGEDEEGENMANENMDIEPIGSPGCLVQDAKALRQIVNKVWPW